MIDAVAGEDEDRPLGDRAALKKRLRDRVRRARGLALSHAPPPAHAVAHGEEVAPGRVGGSFAPEMRDARGVWLERHRRAQQERAVPEIDALCERWREIEFLKRCRAHGSGHGK